MTQSDLENYEVKIFPKYFIKRKMLECNGMIVSYIIREKKAIKETFRY